MTRARLSGWIGKRRGEGAEMDDKEDFKCEITCPYCHAPWSENNVRLYELDAGDHCQSGRFYKECCTIDITCHSCGKLMYRKEGQDLNY